MTYRGAVSADMDPTPLIWTFPADPGSPLSEAIRTPETLPIIPLSTDSRDELAMASPETCEADPVKSDLDMDP